MNLFPAKELKEKMSNLAIIPARSGSKGLKNKNILNLCGKPLMYYSITAAIKSGVFEEVIVSTDSSEYAEIAKECGAKIPFLRSKENSSDKASSWDTVLEVLKCYEKIGKSFDNICLLQPTSPLRDETDIKNAYDLIKKGAKAAVSVCEAEHSPLLVNSLPDDRSMENFLSESGNKRRQDSGKFYRLNGAIYFVNTEFLKENTFIYRKGCKALIMSGSHSVDIDSELDFLYAQTLMSYQRENNI